jgi:K+-transporting ATPase KdpF subunit
MDLIYALGGVFALGVFVYLLVALLVPEKF